LPSFFVKFLTDPSDVVVDIFGGSNTTGRVCEDLGREWLSIEERRDYSALSVVRFIDDDWEPDAVRALVERIEKGECYKVPARPQQASFVMEQEEADPDIAPEIGTPA
jgi:site-specific DNA-methyltransferase (cytosine-N4-specific)